jgi:hypothetical protein
MIQHSDLALWKRYGNVVSQKHFLKLLITSEFHLMKFFSPGPAANAHVDRTVPEALNANLDRTLLA